MPAARDRDATRAVFFRAWEHYRAQLPLQGIEKIVVQVALEHPEYHPLLERPEDFRDRDYGEGIEPRAARQGGRGGGFGDGIDDCMDAGGRATPGAVAGPRATVPGRTGCGFTPESGAANPFLHMGLHIAIAEQLALDQPPGVCRRHDRLRQTLGDEHAVQHRMMECLGEMLRRAGRDGTSPDQAAYLDCLDRLLPETRDSA
jgi:hypothetical protein